MSEQTPGTEQEDLIPLIEGLGLVTEILEKGELIADAYVIVRTVDEHGASSYRRVVSDGLSPHAAIGLLQVASRFEAHELDMAYGRWEWD